jgi:hypothetical protein
MNDATQIGTIDDWYVWLERHDKPGEVIVQLDLTLAKDILVEAATASGTPTFLISRSNRMCFVKGKPTAICVDGPMSEVDKRVVRLTGAALAVWTGAADA